MNAASGSHQTWTARVENGTGHREIGSLLIWTALATTGTGSTSVAATGRGCRIVLIASGSGEGIAEMVLPILAGSVAMTAGTQSGNSTSAETMTAATLIAVMPKGSMIGETATDSMIVSVTTAPATTAPGTTALARTALATTAFATTALATTAPVTNAVTATGVMIVAMRTGGMTNAVTMTGNVIAVMATGGMMTGVAERKTAAMEDTTGTGVVTGVMRPGTEAETVATASVVARTGTTKTAQQRTAAAVVAGGTMSVVATPRTKL